jgi:hypothetical protein
MDNNLMMLLPLIFGQKNPDMMNMMRAMGNMGGAGFANATNDGEASNANGGANNIMSILSAVNQNKGSSDMASMMMSMMGGGQQNTNSAEPQSQNVGHGFMPLNGISTDLINQLILNLIFTAKVK